MGLVFSFWHAAFKKGNTFLYTVRAKHAPDKIFCREEDDNHVVDPLDDHDDDGILDLTEFISLLIRFAKSVPNYSQQFNLGEDLII
jgi:hypothetical protein